MEKIFAILVLSAFALFAATPILAQSTPKTQKTIIVSENEVVEGNYYNAGDLVEIMGTINGDVYITGGQIIVSGIINGDLLAAGGTVTVNGNVSEDVRVVGGQIYIDAQIGDDLSVVGGNIEISNKANIGGGLQTAGGNVVLSGQVGQEMYAGAGNLMLTSLASIGGDLNYAAGEDSQISDEAQIRGDQNRYGEFHYDSKMSPQKAISAVTKTFTAVTKLMSIVTTLFLALIIIFLLPRYSQKGRDSISQNFWKTMGIGFVAMVASPIIFVMIAITFLGIPLAFLFGFIIFWLMYLGRIFVMIAVGEKIVKFYKKSPALWVSFLIGMVTYYLVTPFPLIGGVLKLMTVIVGAGAALIVQHKVFQESKKAKII